MRYGPGVVTGMLCKGRLRAPGELFAVRGVYMEGGEEAAHHVAGGDRRRQFGYQCVLEVFPQSIFGDDDVARHFIHIAQDCVMWLVVRGRGDGEKCGDHVLGPSRLAMGRWASHSC